MKIHFLYVAFLFFFTNPCDASIGEDSSSASASIDRYSLKATLDIEHHLLQCEAELQLHIEKDSVSNVQFELGPNASAVSVRDSLDRKIENTGPAQSADKRGSEISISFPDTIKRGDSFYLRILYRTYYDTASNSPSFISGKEILLAPIDSEQWWPVLSSTAAPLSNRIGPTVVDITLPSSFAIIPNNRSDTILVNGPQTTWRIMRANPTSPFLLCAMSNVVKKTAMSMDSAVQFSLYYVPGHFSAELAKSVMQQLREAYSLFVSVTGKERKASDIRVVFIGSDDGRVQWFNNDGAIVGRNSFAYAVFDSNALHLESRNQWVYELAHFFDIASDHTTFWFNEGWANFLAAKFFLRRYGAEPETQQRMRLSMLSATLDFYPTRTLSEGQTSGKNEQALFFNKGAYVFLMLEYIMGEEAFGSVIKTMYKKFTDTDITITDFELLCEEVYGSPLDWFFKEWAYQTGFPEMILSVDVKQTNRGNYSLKARISHRGDVFVTPVDLVFSSSTRSVTKRVFVEKQDQDFEFILPFLPTKSELDPNYRLLRWIPRLRLLAHARTAVSFRVFDHDLENSEREAMLTLQLDPNNLTGWNNIALFSLGKSAVVKRDLPKAEDYFRRASALEATEPTQLYSVLSLVRLGNVLEMEGKRDEAIEMYKLSITLGERNPSLYNVALFESHQYLQEKFVSSDQFWYGEY